MIVLIPAYKPDNRLISLVDELLNMPEHFAVLVVNDGSGEAYEPIFDQLRARGVTVLTHEINQGKGRALKTGFAYAAQLKSCDGVITADADGQHLPKDVAGVAAKLKQCDDKTFVLGSRAFDESTPPKSRAGNAVTRAVFLWASGNCVRDTQTGLRGFPFSMLSWLSSIGGDRYEYEMDVLLAGARAGYRAEQVLIDTVYFDENKGSHFSAFRDAARIYSVIARYVKGSIFASFFELILFILSYGMFLNLTQNAFGALITCFAAVRIAALIIKYFVFKQKPVKMEFGALLVRSLISLALLLLLAMILPAWAAKLLSSVIPFLLTLVLYNQFAKK